MYTGSQTLASVVATTTLAAAPRVQVPGWLGRAGTGAGELLALLGIVFCIPFAILALGTPIALLVRLLLWIGGAR